MNEHVVLIPGVGGGAWLWQHQVEHLKDIATSEVMVLDAQATRAEMADHVLAHAPDKFVLAGHSLGGWVAQEVAARAPGRISKLFLCDTWARPNPVAMAYIEEYCTHLAEDYENALAGHFHEFLHEDRYQDAAFCARLKQWQREMPAESYIRQLQALARDYQTLSLLPRIKVDTLVIHGRQDRVIAEEECRFLADHITNAKLALIEQSGHVTPLEQPQAFTAVMRLWLSL